MIVKNKPFGTARNLIIALDAILALLIIFFSYQIIATPLGSVAIVFGFLMFLTSMILRFMQIW